MKWLCLLLVVLFVPATPSAQEAHLWHGPLRGGSLLVRAVAPRAGMPVEIANALLNVSPLSGEITLTADVRAMGIKAVHTRGLMLRTAIGPTPDGMATVRLVIDTEEGQPPLSVPRSRAIALTFREAPNEFLPVLAAIDSRTKAVVTLERLMSDTGELVWENPDARELLWRALGKPTSAQ